MSQNNGRGNVRTGRRSDIRYSPGMWNIGRKEERAILSWNSGMAWICGKCWREEADLLPDMLRGITDQIAEGIQYLHERQHPFLYRVLKPENTGSVSTASGDLGSGMPVEQRRKMVGSRQLFLQCAGTVPTGGDTRGGKRCVCHGKIVGGHAGREKRETQQTGKMASQNKPDGDSYRATETYSGYENLPSSALRDECIREGAQTGIQRV